MVDGKLLGRNRIKDDHEDKKNEGKKSERI
jgi:hypothetical protein